jgi:hypothetical protein
VRSAEAVALLRICNRGHSQMVKRERSHSLPSVDELVN